MSVARFIADQRTEHRVPHAFTCRVLGVSASWFYKWLNRPATPRQSRRAELDAAVKEAFEASKGTYGSPRIHAELIDPARLRGPTLRQPGRGGFRSTPSLTRCAGRGCSAESPSGAGG